MADTRYSVIGTLVIECLLSCLLISYHAVRDKFQLKVELKETLLDN